MGRRFYHDKAARLRRKVGRWRRLELVYPSLRNCGCHLCMRRAGVTPPAPYDRAAEKRIVRPDLPPGPQQCPVCHATDPECSTCSGRGAIWN